MDDITTISRDENIIIPALRMLRPGESMVYFRGYLVREREGYAPGSGVGVRTIDGAQRKSSAAIGDAAYRMAGSGKLQLTQRKLASERYDYIATKGTAAAK